MSAPGKSPASRRGRFRELGPINWVLAKLGARRSRAPEMHLFTTLGQRQLLFWAWSIYSGRLLRGRLPRDRHRVGDPAGRASALMRIRAAAPSADGAQGGPGRGHAGHDFRLAGRPAAGPGALTDRQQALLKATDEFVKDRTITDRTWQQLASHLDRHQLIEFCLLASQYDGLAATMSALEIPLDNPQANGSSTV